MTKLEFETLLNLATKQLRSEALNVPFTSAKQFEHRVRQVIENLKTDPGLIIDFNPHPQAFPDIACGEFGIEVKFTTNDTWRSVANSVLETNRIQDVKHVYLVFGKMGGDPCVKWGKYEECVMHVRTSHVPRFEVEIGATTSLFDQIGVTYDDFRSYEMHDKMQHIRKYARARLSHGERLWWLEDSAGEEHSLPIQARLYTQLSTEEKLTLRAEAILLCPEIVKPNGSKFRYENVALYLLTYHGVLCHQARDMFSAGSVANPKNDDDGGPYIPRMLKRMEEKLLDAAQRMDAALFEEYWGEAIEPEHRIKEWLRRADSFAVGWKPSEQLFL